MVKNLILLLIIFLFSFCTLQNEKQIDNDLTKKEQRQGWFLLWDGKSFKGWRGINKDYFPTSGWIIENGELMCIGSELPDSLRGGDIITTVKYDDFELRFDFKILENANSGIKYFVDESLSESKYHGLGLEYAILDNKNWPYDKPEYNRTCGSLYDLVRSPDNAIVNAYGEWNHGMIKVEKNHIQHWLNGVKTVDIIKNSEEYFDLVERSKYANIKGWGDFREGHILIQDEGPRTAFKNIKIKKL